MQGGDAGVAALGVSCHPASLDAGWQVATTNSMLLVRCASAALVRYGYHFRLHACTASVMIPL